jgi:hypothetical protein
VKRSSSSATRIRITASFARKITAVLTGSVCTCFQAWLFSSSWVMRLVARIAPSGRKKMAIDSQQARQRFGQNVSAA